MSALGRCVAHPDAQASAPCPRCGDFACDACFETTLAGRMCKRCVARTGGSLWPAGRTMSARALLVAALGRLPRLVSVILLSVLLYLPMQIVAVEMLKLQKPGMAPPLNKIMDLALFQCGGLVFMLGFMPFVMIATAACAADDLTEARERRSVWHAGSSLYLRSVVIEVVAFGVMMAAMCLPMMFVFVGMLSGWFGGMPQPGAPPDPKFTLAIVVVGTVPTLPLMSVWFLSLAALAVEGRGAIASIRRAIDFLRAQPKTWLGLMGIQLVIMLPMVAVGQAVQPAVMQWPTIAEPIAVSQAILASISTTLWSVVFVAFYLGRQTIDEG